jgi:flagellar FliJ protein
MPTHRIHGVTNKFPLQSVLDLSHMKLDEATRRLGELIADQQQAAERLDLLVQYRDEYHARFLAAAREGISREQWHNYHAFLERLDVAIAQARQMMAHSRQLTAAGQQEWVQKKGRVQAFDTLAQRHEARMNYAEARQEQKDLDEHASRLHFAKSDKEE